jgi:hypothetical protein
MMTNDELIAKAASLIKAKKIGVFTVADVGCALITDRGNVYTGSRRCERACHPERRAAELTTDDTDDTDYADRTDLHVLICEISGIRVISGKTFYS